MSGLWIGKADYEATFDATGLNGRMARRGLGMRLDGKDRMGVLLRVPVCSHPPNRQNRGEHNQGDEPVKPERSK
jgi:hypothetical protein